MNPPTGYIPLYQLTRGQTVESVHFGAVAVVTAQGQLLAWAGDPQQVTFLRSSSKPFQALPFIESGSAAALGLTDQEIALTCASHSGTDQHVAVARAIQQKGKFLEDALGCGVHPAYDKTTAEAMAARGEKPTPNRHNCSGKHSGMLAYAQANHWALDTYLELDHPVQTSILQGYAEMVDLAPEQIALGTDGCSAPNFAMPLYNAALGYARLVDPTGLPPARAEACRKITRAMTHHPDMVAGPDRFDTLLMQTGGGSIVAKGGAEGYQGIGIFPGALAPAWQEHARHAHPGLPGGQSPALGIALKIADGDQRAQARSAVVLEVLRQLGALTPEALESLGKFGPTLPVYNWRKLLVGQASPCFELQWN